MPDCRIVARRPSGAPVEPRYVTDPDRLRSFLEDAAHVPGGHATALVIPTTEFEVAAVMQDAAAVLPIGAQSSLTGGATPRGEVLLGMGPPSIHASAWPRLPSIVALRRRLPT